MCAEFQLTFPVLTGVLSQSYMIHNCIISIVKNQRYPEHNVCMSVLRVVRCQCCCYSLLSVHLFHLELRLSSMYYYLIAIIYVKGRDLSIAFCLVAATYIAIASVFYVCFPLPKFCIFDVSAVKLISSLQAICTDHVRDVHH